MHGLVILVPETLTPKQVARAIGVSESSLKRWCDQGLLPSFATPGGHRRLPISGVLEFVRQGKHSLVDPAAIGLPKGTGGRKLSLPAAKEALRAALVAGDETAARQVVIDLFLSQFPVSRMCDELLAKTFHEIGQLWECGDIAVYRERRACRICLRMLHEIRTLQPRPAANGPIAMGGTPAGDIYDVPTTMVELVLRQNGWQATSLGSSLPLETLAAAIAENEPQLFWLSVSHLADERQFLRDYEQLQAVAAEKSTAIIVGGRALTEPIRQQMQFAACCENLQQLEEFVATLKAAPAASGRRDSASS